MRLSLLHASRHGIAAHRCCAMRSRSLSQASCAGERLGATEHSSAGPSFAAGLCCPGLSGRGCPASCCGDALWQAHLAEAAPSQKAACCPGDGPAALSGLLCCADSCPASLKSFRLSARKSAASSTSPPTVCACRTPALFWRGCGLRRNDQQKNQTVCTACRANARMPAPARHTPQCPAAARGSAATAQHAQRAQRRLLAAAMDWLKPLCLVCAPGHCPAPCRPACCAGCSAPTRPRGSCCRRGPGPASMLPADPAPSPCVAAPQGDPCMPQACSLLRPRLHTRHLQPLCRSH